MNDNRNQILLVWFQVDRIAGGNGNVYGLTFSGVTTVKRTIFPELDYKHHKRQTEIMNGSPQTQEAE
ncbi:hypothetical protein MAR_019537 [Mya arenaria]|uniref:Uncharacterized protein n=1 Tax=Mya arenaria TaxID=6604 RepID=A0ABY7E2A2_MYAAR|nr:hypothetical protein MAR_019537 [Mya arenaria]